MSLKTKCTCGHAKAEHIQVRLNAYLERERYIAACKECECDCMEFVPAKKPKPRKVRKKAKPKVRRGITLAGYVPRELGLEIKAMCKEKGIPFSEFVTRAIENEWERLKAE